MHASRTIIHGRLSSTANYCFSNETTRRSIDTWQSMFRWHLSLHFGPVTKSYYTQAAAYFCYEYSDAASSRSWQMRVVNLCCVAVGRVCRFPSCHVNSKLHLVRFVVDLTIPICCTIEASIMGAPIFKPIRKKAIIFPLARYDIFLYWIVDLRNCLPTWVVKSQSVDSLKTNLDTFWCNQDIYYKYKATITRTGNRSIVMW